MEKEAMNKGIQVAFKSYKRQENQFSSRPFRGSVFYGYLDFRFLVSKTVRE